MKDLMMACSWKAETGCHCIYISNILSAVHRRYIKVFVKSKLVQEQQI
jgi:hypothetical protein